MRNIFLLYMPPGNAEAMVPNRDERIAQHVPATLGRKLQQIFGPNRIAVWGSRSGIGNRRNFDRMNDGDEILILEGRRHA